MLVIDEIQRRLEFKQWVGYPQFTSDEGLGRVASIALMYGSMLSLHVAGLLLISLDITGNISLGVIAQLSPSRTLLLYQWLVYIIVLCVFHLSEFFVTAIWNPSVLTARCFMLDHSKAYTVAMLTSVAEFIIRFLLYPSKSSVYVSVIGLMFVSVGQFFRSLAMITCAESFNHYIQCSKKQSHKLVTHGVYRYFRHPSYVGFYYWSVGSQLVLGNIFTSIAYAIASWVFFNRRIPFEEQTLIRLFPKEYPLYMKQSWIGIPCVQSTAIFIEKDNS